MKKLLFLFALMLISCKSDEETRIFTVTTNAIPLEGGTLRIPSGIVRVVVADGFKDFLNAVGWVP